ncbi:Retrovirus-related Pol polyprotein from type-1 retrotransposable element R2 [Eumeta japonica]|uniref:Retrovirus-related Pol polyprotein from type-1 retrotransposable element R2 n=1 Tax=Eumeta variegata TaxID=151549 RepID=A0A4C1SWL7_EUMVA|nr:Retrovirus-related Pol polyprotein from type-1 retrotransposable element R2 [Eumeta japonica]
MTHRNWIGKLKKEYGETKTRQDVINHATEFCKELYKKYSETNETEDSLKDFEEEEETVKPIDECEVLEHLKKLKTEKSPDASQPIEQAGFRSGFSTIDHIHTLEQILEKYKEFNQPLYVAYVDYTKAFDTITHTSIWKALNVCGVSKTYINIIKNIYSKSTSRIKMENKGKQISIEKGVKHGDPLSPKLFIAVLECVFRNPDWSQNGICVLGHHLSHLRFADDIIVFAKSAK